MTPAISAPLLNVEALRVGLRRLQSGLTPVIDSVSFVLRANETLGIVGESGSGKTMLCRSLIGTLHRHGAMVMGGRIMLGDQDLAHADERSWRKVRGRVIGYVPQSSMASLNPVLTVEAQLAEALEAIGGWNGRQTRAEALRLLDAVRIPRAQQVLHQYSHELSGGMRQRVVIATAIAQRPKLLIADEPTTALDVTVQHQILDLIKELQSEFDMAIILVSHDLAVIDEVCDSVAVMYAGATVEVGVLDRVMATERHPYTRALRLSSVDLATAGKPLQGIEGEAPSVGAWPDGCRFWPRCPMAQDACQRGQQPPLSWVDGRWTACIRAEELAAPA